jgi:hypothetical protein
MSAPDKIWAVYGRVYERKPETEGLGDEYIRKDAADAEKAEAVAREREACAQLACDMDAKYMRSTYEVQYDRKRYDIEGVTRCVYTAANLISEDIAAAIRARGQG